MHRKLLILLPALLLLVACQPSLKKPVVEIRGLSPVQLQQGRFTVRLQLHNPVKRSYHIEQISVLLKLDPQLHLKGSRDVDLEMGNNATELIQLDVQRTQLSKILWTGFINRPGDAMPYTAEVTLRLKGGKVWKTELKGDLFKVPGKPWHLRG